MRNKLVFGETGLGTNRMMIKNLKDRENKNKKSMQAYIK